MKTRVIVSITNDLVTDNRVHKVCSTLHNNGYDVLLVGRYSVTSRSHSSTTPYPTKRLRLFFNKSALFYAEYNIRLFFFLLFAKSPHIFLSNDTDTLPANYLAAKLRNKKLVFDSHEIFPEVPELANRPFVKKVWRKIEDIIFPKLAHSYTVCKSISDEYYKRYGIKMAVVRNIPLAQTENHTQPSKKTQAIIKQIEQHKMQGKKIILYQGAVNLGRGIERVIEAMPLLPEFVFYVVGDGDLLPDFQKQSEQKAESQNVIFTGRVPANELLQITATADVGVNILENRGLNYYYSLPNRIFDYMRAGIPVVSSDFPEIRNITETYKTGILLTEQADTQTLANAIKEAAENKQHFEQNCQNACKHLSWENEVPNLLNIFRNFVI